MEFQPYFSSTVGSNPTTTMQSMQTMQTMGHSVAGVLEPGMVMDTSNSHQQQNGFSHHSHAADSRGMYQYGSSTTPQANGFAHNLSNNMSLGMGGVAGSGRAPAMRRGSLVNDNLMTMHQQQYRQQQMQSHCLQQQQQQHHHQQQQQQKQQFTSFGDGISHNNGSNGFSTSAGTGANASTNANNANGGNDHHSHNNTAMAAPNLMPARHAIMRRGSLLGANPSMSMSSNEHRRMQQWTQQSQDYLNNMRSNGETHAFQSHQHHHATPAIVASKPFSMVSGNASTASGATSSTASSSAPSSPNAMNDDGAGPSKRKRIPVEQQQATNGQPVAEKKDEQFSSSTSAPAASAAPTPTAIPSSAPSSTPSITDRSKKPSKHRNDPMNISGHSTATPVSLGGRDDEETEMMLNEAIAAVTSPGAAAASADVDNTNSSNDSISVFQNSEEFKFFDDDVCTVASSMFTNSLASLTLSPKQATTNSAAVGGPKVDLALAAHNMSLTLSPVPLGTNGNASQNKMDSASALEYLLMTNSSSNTGNGGSGALLVDDAAGMGSARQPTLLNTPNQAQQQRQHLGASPLHPTLPTAPMLAFSALSPTQQQQQQQSAFLQHQQQQYSPMNGMMTSQLTAPLVTGMQMGAANMRQDQSLAQQQPRPPPQQRRRSSTGGTSRRQNHKDKALRAIKSVNEDIDVFLGRGGGSNNQNGNKRYQQVVSQYTDAYHNSGTNHEKTNVAVSIVNFIQSYGGRFVFYDKEEKCNFEITMDAAVKKVRQRLRENCYAKFGKDK